MNFEAYLFSYEVRSQSLHGGGNFVNGKTDSEQWFSLLDVRNVRFVALRNRNDHMALVAGRSRYLDVKLRIHRRRF